MTDQPKSMGLFFIDNKASWPKNARLVGDLVVWEDNGKYPQSYPVASANHPAFDGRVVVQAAARVLIVSFIRGAKNTDDIMKALSALPNSSFEDRAEKADVCHVTQVQIGVDAIINRLALDLFSTDAIPTLSEAHPFALMKALAETSPNEANVLVKALKTYMRHGDISKDALSNPQAWSHADDMLSNLESNLKAGS